MGNVPHKQTVAMRYMPDLLDHYNEVSKSGIDGTEPDVMARDLLVDLMHAAPSLGFDFEDVLDRARWLYSEEV